ncbi:MAG: hypothetical protein AAGJ83_05035, partial [Planctomycetota bacterium]
LDTAAADGSPQFFQRDYRVDLTQAASAGSTHAFRLALNPQGTNEITHGLGRAFTPTTPAIATIDPSQSLANNEITQAHSFVTGDAVVYDDGFTSNDSATAIGGLYRGQIVYVIVTSSTTFKLAESPAAALAGTAINLDASQASGNAHTLRKTVISPTGAVNLGYQHGFVTGDQVVYSRGGGEAIGGLGHGTVYFVVDGPKSIRLADTATNAQNNETLSLSPYFATGSHHGFGRVFRPVPIVDSSANSISFNQPHPFETGDAITYDSGTGVAIGGLVSGNTYYVIDVDGQAIQLSLTRGGTAINLDGTLATGSEHRIGTLSADGSVVSAGSGAVIAQNSGTIVSVTLAGSIVSTSPGSLVDISGSGGGGGGQLIRRRDSSVDSAMEEPSRASFSSASGNNQPAQPANVNNAAAQQQPDTSRRSSFAGAITVHVINDTTVAAINDSNVTFRELDVRAANKSNSVAVTGALAVSRGSAEGKGIAGAISVDVIDNETYAVIESSVVNVLGGDLNVDAFNDSDIVAVAMGAAGVSGKKALAGSVVVNTIGSEAHAKIIDGSDIIVLANPGTVGSGKAIVEARDENRIVSVTGAGGLVFGAGGDSKTGVGAAINVNVLDPREGTTAIVEDSDLTTDGQAVLDASVRNIVTPITVALATALGGATPKALAAAISLGVVVIDGTTRSSARRKKSRGISAKGGLTVNADDLSNVTTVAGGAALSGSLGGLAGSGRALGASINFTYLDQDVIADITDMPVSSTEGNVIVDATSSPKLTSVAAGAAIAGTVAAQGSFSIAVVNNDTTAFITNANSTIAADGSVKVEAKDNMQIANVAGSVALGSLLGSSESPITSVGLANSTLVTTNQTRAFIDDDLTIQANGDRGTVPVARVDVTDGSFLTDQRAGVIVNAVSNDQLTNVAAGGAISGFGGGTSIAGSVTVTVIDENTEAWIGDRTRINTNANLVTQGANESTLQDVRVTAAENTQLVGVAGALGISFADGGIGAGADVAIVKKNTLAEIESNAVIEANGDVIVDAGSEEDVVSVSASAGAGKNFGAAFGLGVSVFNIDTTADIGSATRVTASGSVLVDSFDEFGFEIGSGSIAFGLNKAGIGGAIAVPVVNKTTTATVHDNAMIDASALRSGFSVPTGDFQAFSCDTSQTGVIGQ